MARPLVSDELWELVEPLIPKVPEAAPVSWSKAAWRPKGANGDSVRVADGDPVPLARRWPRTAQARDYGQDRSAGKPAPLRIRRRALGCRTDNRLAAPAPPPTRPLWTPRRHARSAAANRLVAW